MLRPVPELKTDEQLPLPVWISRLADEVSCLAMDPRENRRSINDCDPAGLFASHGFFKLAVSYKTNTLTTDRLRVRCKEQCHLWAASHIEQRGWVAVVLGDSNSLCSAHSR